MTIVELVKAFMDDSPVAVVVTDGNLEPPGPTILYANAAFGQLTGHDLAEAVGQNPRIMQGRETRRTKLDAFHQALAAGNRFHGFLTNYRADGTKYRVEIDCRPIASGNGTVEHFISFQREVIRRLGRPTSGVKGRYVPGSVSNDLLTNSLRAMDVFNGDEDF
ncbi:UNVERIFIED_CONTAM: PAS domain-containing protein [Methylobacteriaceae bacterium AG10]|nr:PAS domain-containing protein [Methylobacteriaceae bacterium AG10]